MVTDLPERFGRDQRNLAAANMMRRALHAEPAHPSDYGLHYEYAEVLPEPPGLKPGWLWIADSGRFERPYSHGGVLAVMAVHHLRDLRPGERLWLHLYPESGQTGVGPNPADMVMLPWVCIDTAEEDYAIWRYTGALYTSDPWEGVADDPIWQPPADAQIAATWEPPRDARIVERASDVPGIPRWPEPSA